MSRTICESKIHPSDVFFHGSSEKKISSVDKPSYLHPFYVTTDIHYAMAFCTKRSSSTGDWDNGAHSTFTPSDSNYVYVISIKPDAEFYDFRNDAHNDAFPILSKIIPTDVIRFVRQRMSDLSDSIELRDIYSFVAQLLGDAIFPFFRFKGKYDEYTIDIDSSSLNGRKSSIKRCMTQDQFFAVAQMAKDFNLKDVDYDVHEVMACILKSLHKLGFKGVITAEKDFNEERYGIQVVTEFAIGIFDVSAIDCLSIIPMRYRWLKKITPIDVRANLTANQKILHYIHLYKKLARQ